MVEFRPSWPHPLGNGKNKDPKKLCACYARGPLLYTGNCFSLENCTQQCLWQVVEIVSRGQPVWPDSRDFGFIILSTSHNLWTKNIYTPPPTRGLATPLMLLISRSDGTLSAWPGWALAIFLACKGEWTVRQYYFSSLTKYLIFRAGIACRVCSEVSPVCCSCRWSLEVSTICETDQLAFQKR